MDDTTATPDPTAEPADGEHPASEDRIPFTARIPQGLLGELRDYSESVDWSVNSALIACIRGWLWTAKNHWLDQPHDATVDEAWRQTEEAGSAGSAYEIAITFQLPASMAVEGLPYEIRDRVLSAVDSGGGRSTSSRIAALRPMGRDPRCEEAGCTHA